MMALLRFTFTCALLLPLSALVRGHGNMVRPYAWWDANKIGWYFLENGDESMVGCGTLPFPPNEFEQITGRAPDCARMWFIKTELPAGQEATLPEELSQPEVKCVGQEAENDPERMAQLPWAAPGPGGRPTTRAGTWAPPPTGATTTGRDPSETAAGRTRTIRAGGSRWGTWPRTTSGPACRSRSGILALIRGPAINDVCKIFGIVPTLVCIWF